MKILKLAGLFILIVGAIIGILFLTGIDSGTKKTEIPNEVLKEYRQDFSKGWAEAGDWDKALFERYCKDVETLSKNYDVTELRDFNVNEATDKIFTNIFVNWKNSACSKNKIDNYVSGAKLVTDYDQKMERNEGIIKLRRVNSVYQDAYNFAHKSIGYSPAFNGSSWNNFESYSQQQRRVRDQILNNADYKEYLSNITDIKEGLGSLESKLTQAKKTFYNTLESQIIRHYNKIPTEERTVSELENLKKVQSAYNNETSSKSAGLSTLVKSFEADVTRNLNKES